MSSPLQSMIDDGSSPGPLRRLHPRREPLKQKDKNGFNRIRRAQKSISSRNARNGRNLTNADFWFPSAILIENSFSCQIIG